MLGAVRLAAAWSLLHATVLATDEYVPMHKRNTFDARMDDFSYLGMLSRRDVCSDAFGEDAEKATCVPSMTLCCIRRSESFPSCQQYLGKGWCCVGENDKDSCYVDQKSACREENAVECANLEEGTDRACCPRFTTCDSSLKASEDYVRCNINQGDLKSFHSASIASTAVTSSTSQSTSAASETTETSSPPSSSETTDNSRENGNDGSDGDSDSGLSTGAIAGIAVGGVAVLALIGVAVWWFLKKKNNKTGGDYQAAQQEPLSIPQFYEQQQMKQQHQQQGYNQGQYDPAYAGQHNGYHSGYSSPPPSELPGHGQQAVEMDGGSNTYR